MNKVLLKTSSLYLLLVCFFLAINFAHGKELDNRLVNKVKQGVVSTSNIIAKSAYRGGGKSFASGFLVNKELGIILTNAHVADNANINNLTITFYNGREAEAKFIYNDPLCDFAFLKVDSNHIPKEIQELKLSKDEVQLQQPVFIIGNNEGQAFSMQTGTISTKYQGGGWFPCQSYAISLNTKGGSSGSPVFNHKGEVVALNFGFRGTFAEALKIQYVIDALDYVKNNKLPPRYGIGAIISYSALEKLVKYNNFPQNLLDNYSDKYPDSLNRALVVEEIFQDSPAHGILMPGDVIWKVNGYEIGPNMYNMVKIINNAKTEVTLTIYRDGNLLSVHVKPYDLHRHSIKRIVVFGGARFYEVDEKIRMITGAKLGSLFVTKIERGSSFFDAIPYLSDYSPLNGASMVQIVELGDQKINNLDDIVAIIPKLIRTKNFIVKYINYLPTIGYDSLPYARRNVAYSDVEYKSYGDDPTELIFNESIHQWDVKKIQLVK